jgi:hypothetical protein
MSDSKVVLLARQVSDGSYRAFGTFRSLMLAGRQVIANDVRTVALWDSEKHRWLIGLDAYDVLLIECFSESIPYGENGLEEL